MTGSPLHRTLEAIVRLESPRLIAAIARVVRDVGAAEELVQDAIVAALEQWPVEGVPRNPGAWLMAVARNHAINRVQRLSMARRKHEQLEREGGPDLQALARAEDPPDDLGDDLLRLIFTACHPLLAIEARVALTLRLVGGLTTEEISRAFLVPVPTMAQRLVRAKRTLAERRVPFEVPPPDRLAERLPGVLAVVYLVFNEGYSSTKGDEVLRPELCEDALRLGRTLAALLPSEPEVHGLLALMELHASRAESRVGPAGEPVLLLEQDRARWDQLLIARGLEALARIDRLGGPSGPYGIQAAISACHARARVPSDTDWRRIVSLYGELARVAPSPVVELNRAVAVGMAEGPAAGLALLERLATEPALRRYHLLPSARADLLLRLGRHEEARADFERAAALATSGRDRRALRDRAAACSAALGHAEP